jgi:TRAP-type C4-dicarboxylate transport system substrate-binding protein
MTMRRFALMLMMCAGALAAAPVIKLATVLPSGTSYHQILQTMGQDWRNAPGGGATLIVFAGSQMGDEGDIVRKMRVGALQAAVLSVVGLSEIDKSVTALQYMPMMFRSLDEVDYVRLKLQPELERRLTEKGYTVLFWGDVGWVRFFAREPVVHPADLRKHKVFVWAGDNYQVDIMKSLGYQPVPLVTADILPGLQTGMITAVPLAPFYALAGQVYGRANNMLEINWAPLVGATVVLKKTWDGLGAEARQGLMQGARKAGEQMRTRGRLEGDLSVEAMKKRGLKVQTVTPAVEAEWRTMAEGVYPRIRGTMVPAEMFDHVQALLKEYRAKK